jgi:hypothetical protein
MAALAGFWPGGRKPAPVEEFMIEEGEKDFSENA